jgi:PadR family transcriptional regulator AphA
VTFVTFDQERADAEPIRLTGTSFAVLALLELLGPSTPYDLKQALEKSIENFWPVPHTTFYAEPARLVRGGYLSVRQEQGGRRRKLYTLTKSGRGALHEWLRDAVVAPPQYRDEGVLKIFAGADPLPILRSRREWHRAKLAELEGYLEELGDEERLQGVRTSLVVGTTYHRQLLEPIERFVADAEADDSGQARRGEGERQGSGRGGRGAQTGRAAQAATGSS